ncbi:hypothetical protein GWN91_02845, partial [Candidatus Saccharibacteria bacterium]|nr:hypothetical protein [Candidatus Saccharibacteria bacterium]
LLLGIIVLANNVRGDQKSRRATIDSLRWGFDYKSAEAYRNANRAQYLDSTYYVGYLIEGYHFFEKAEDQRGIAKAVPPLNKALDLFENDFGYCLNKRYSKGDIYTGAYRDLLRQIDYLTISSTLVDCYFSLEQPDKVYQALSRLKDTDLAYDYRSFQGLAWLYFRSRIYDNEKYAFLKNTIERNLQTSLAYTDSLQLKYQKNTPYVRSQILEAYAPGTGVHQFFQESFVEQPSGYIANTRGILYGYNLRPQIAVNYFEKMSGEDNLAKFVNLGYTYHSDINFRKAEEYFSSVPDKGSKSRGSHWQGYSTIFVYKGQPLEGALRLQERRDEHGYTIGYGWDNLCLARMYVYSGQLEECEAALNKAAEFSEVHYNTSFREDQYQFMLKTLRLMLARFKLKATHFENKNKWMSWNWWKEMPPLTLKKYKTVYQLANELALNPEREMVYYHIFHTESIISFDELWEIIKNYSNNFFEKTFRKYSQTDPRKNLQRYYEYFLGKLKMAADENEFAYDQLTAILNDPSLDREYEKLLIAR